MSSKTSPLNFYNSYILSFKDYIEEYFEKQNKSYNYTNALLSIIILFAFYLRRSSEYCETGSDYENKILGFIEVLRKIPSLEISTKRGIIDNLETLCKKTNSKSKKFFATFDKLPYQNNYLTVNEELKYILVNFNISIDELSVYNKDLVNKYDKKYQHKFLEIEYHLLGLRILKESLMNQSSNYIVKAPISYLKRKNSLKIFDSPVIKHKINFLIDVNDYKDNQELINKIKDKSYKIIIDLKEDEELELLNNEKVLTDKNFKNRNKEKLEEIKEKNIEIIENNFEEGVENGTI